VHAEDKSGRDDGQLSGTGARPAREIDGITCAHGTSVARHASTGLELECPLLCHGDGTSPAVL
jgi:hypothetical protein